jgi:hypothetical protein
MVTGSPAASCAGVSFLFSGTHSFWCAFISVHITCCLSSTFSSYSSFCFKGCQWPVFQWASKKYSCPRLALISDSVCASVFLLERKTFSSHNFTLLHQRGFILRKTSLSVSRFEFFIQLSFRWHEHVLVLLATFLAACSACL